MAEWSIFRTKKANRITQSLDSASPLLLAIDSQLAAVPVPFFSISTNMVENIKGRRSMRTSSRVFSAIILCIPIPTPSITANNIAQPIAEFLAALNPPRIANEPPVKKPAPTSPPSAIIHPAPIPGSLPREKTHTGIPRIFLLPKSLDRTIKRREQAPPYPKVSPQYRRTSLDGRTGVPAGALAGRQGGLWQNRKKKINGEEEATVKTEDQISRSLDAKIQRRLFYGTSREEEGFPYRNTSGPREREELLRRLVFPRDYGPTLYRIWWTVKWTPLLLKTLVVLGVRYPFWRMRNPRPSGKEDVVVKSRIGRFFHDFVTQEEFFWLLNTTMQPWGEFATNHGRSMRPTFSGNPAISYSSYAYVEGQDVSVGDVVTVLGPKYDRGRGILLKRVAAIEGARIYLKWGQYNTQEILQIPQGHCFVLGDNPESTDSRHFGALPIEAVWSKVRFRWGLDGFHWINHNQRPWEENGVIKYLAPGQNRPSQKGTLIKQPEKKSVVKNPNVIFISKDEKLNRQKNCVLEAATFESKFDLLYIYTYINIDSFALLESFQTKKEQEMNGIRRIMPSSIAIAATLILIARAALARDPISRDTQLPLTSSSFGNSRPNIVFFLTDDQDAHLGSLSYQPFVQKHLINEGLAFQRHFCTVALCCPSRVNLWTGKAAHNTNVTDVTPPYGGYPKFVSQGLNEQYLPIWLQDAGYNTFYTGKLFNAHTVENHHSPYPAGFTGSDFLLDPYTYEYHNSTWQRNRDPPVSHEGQYTTDVLAYKAKGFLDDAVKAGEPFFLTIAPVAPHSNVEVHGGSAIDPQGSFTITPPISAERHKHLFTNVKIPRTDHFNPEKAGRPHLYSIAIRMLTMIQPSGANWVHRLPRQSDAQVEYNDEFYRSRLRALQPIDELVDNVFRLLDDDGILDNTYVFYTSDNGYHIGQHRLPPGKECAYEEDVNIPLIVRGPGISRGSATDQVTSHTDLVPTIFDLVGLKIEDDFDGAAIKLHEDELQESLRTRQEHVNLEYWGFALAEGKYGYGEGEAEGTRLQLNNTYKALRLISNDYNVYYSVWCNNEHELYDMTYIIKVIESTRAARTYVAARIEPPIDEEATSVSESVPGKTDSKLATDIVGVISVLLLGAFIANADISIVLATYSTISSEFDSLENASWLVVTYSLAICAIQPTYGKLSDLYGRKATLLVAYSFFALGCAVCGAAATLWQVILGRAIAGLGGAGMTSLVSVLIADKVPLRDVATWRGYVNVASTVGRSAGGPIGGFLADTIGWRWSFFIQCPLALLAIVLVALKLDHQDRSLPVDVKSPSQSKLRRIDFLGSISLALTIVMFIVPLYFQVTANASETNAGAHLVPAVFGNAIGGLLSGFIVKRTDSYKLLTLVGTLSSSLCYLLLIFRWRGNTSIWESLYIGPGGFGTGIVLSTTFVALNAGVDETLMAIASTSLYLSVNVGGLVGLKDLPDRQAITEKALSDLEYVKGLNGHVRDVVIDAYVHSFEYTFYVSLGCSVLASLMVLCMREHDL
ncbi:MAG: hypothetical protein ASARMPRED_001227 [Alectoria sarmentosa]|nr:MAG: hypothetical protein ASARMPRED_001227 [Alectoria sarmentosa]